MPPETVWVVAASYGLQGCEAVAVFDREPTQEELDAIEVEDDRQSVTGYGGLWVDELTVRS